MELGNFSVKTTSALVTLSGHEAVDRILLQI